MPTRSLWAALTAQDFPSPGREDPDGLRPGRALGPGAGWGGDKTDIWYSYITMADFRTVDMNFEIGGAEHDEEDFVGRPKALVPMSFPVRLSDNDVVNTENMKMRLYSNGYPVVHSDGNFIPLNGGSSIADVSYESENLTRCVKFEGGETIVETGSPEDATYKVLPTLPASHKSSMNCTNCHVPYGTDDGTIFAPPQGAPVPLVVVDDTIPAYLGRFYKC